MTEVLALFNTEDEFVGYTSDLCAFESQNPHLNYEEISVVFVEVPSEPSYDTLSQDLTWRIEHLGNKVCEYHWQVVDVSEEERAKRVAQQNTSIAKQRSDAYRLEADPLHFKYQRGEVTEAEWLAKIEEIKQRYPKVV